MTKMGSSILMIIIVINMVTKSSSFPSFFDHVCSNTSTYSNNSNYQTNVNTLLTFLSSNASTNANGFYSTTVGHTSDDTVHGFFMCRGDQNTSQCSDCVATAVKDRSQTSECAWSKQVIFYYDECMLRHDNQTLAGTLDQGLYIYMKNGQNVTGNQTEFEQLAKSTMNMLSIRAARGDGKKYATTATDCDQCTSGKLYILDQCVPDLTDNDCYQCLQSVNSQSLGGNRLGARSYLPSCNVRYEMYPFFTGALDLSSPPPSPAMVNISPPSLLTGKTEGGNGNVSIGMIVAIVASVATVLIVLVILGICLIKTKAKKKDTIAVDSNAGEDISLIQSIQYDLNTLQSATNNFSEQNKLGQGGFGAVYKGRLANGQEIAVKKLSKNSTQGLREFKNEALLVTKLQHRNLVKLLGFCVEGEEKLLVYEFVANKSLDHFLFDPIKQGLLDWEIRNKIIQGIARGMLYLHQDSRLTIIHRDLKASNILLDTNMNPKISDFGMASIFGVDQTQGNTSRIVGTFGYMSPEYAMQGQFSTKSDVYSFGVLVLEIISGKRNNTFYQTDEGDDLLSYAWKQWKEGSHMDLVDPTIRNSCSSHELMRCLHLGLLCVQESISERPTMATIVLMLDSVSVTLPVPEQPSITIRSRSVPNFSKEISGSEHSSSKPKPWSVNDVSITEPEAR